MLRTYLVRYSSIVYVLIALELCNSSTQKFPKIWNVENYNRYFIGREDFLNLINYVFKNESNIVSLTGVGGMGKSQIAKKFAEVNKNNYDIIWWIDASKDIDGQYKSLAQSWNEQIIFNNQDKYYIDTINFSKKEITRKIKNILRITNLNYLIIFDNVINKEDIIQFIPDNHNNSLSHIIITSKKANMVGKRIKVSTFKREESIAFIDKLINDKSIYAASKLAQELYDYPLAISQALAYIKCHHSLSLEVYIKLLKKDPKMFSKDIKKTIKYLAKNIDVTDNYLTPAVQTINLTLSKIKERSDSAYKLMLICSLLNNNNIPKELILNLKINNKGDLNIYEDLSLLEEYSLIEKNNIDSNIQTYNTHEIVQKVILDETNKNILKKFLNLIINELNKKIPDQIDILVPYIDQNPYILPHAIKIIKLCKQYNIYNNQILALNLRVLQYYLPGERNFDKGSEFLNNIEHIKMNLLYLNPLLNVRSMVMKAALLDWKEGKYKEAESILKAAVKLISNIKEAYEEKLMVYNRITQTYQLLGDIYQSIKYSDLGMNIIEEAGKSNVYLGNQDAFYITRSRIKMDLGKYDEAMENIEIAYSKLPKNSPFIGSLLPAIATEIDILLKKKLFKEANNKSTKMVELANRYISDSEHLYFAIIKSRLGHSLYGLNRLKEAENNLRESLIIFDKCQYTNTKFNAIAHMLLGMVLMHINKHEESQKHLLKSQEIFESNYVKKETDDISRLYSLLVKNSLKLNDDGLARYYAERHYECFGNAHHRSLEIKNYLAS